MSLQKARETLYSETTEAAKAILNNLWAGEAGWPSFLDIMLAGWLHLLRTGADLRHLLAWDQEADKNGPVLTGCVSILLQTGITYLFAGTLLIEH